MVLKAISVNKLHRIGRLGIPLGNCRWILTAMTIGLVLMSGRLLAAASGQIGTAGAASMPAPADYHVAAQDVLSLVVVDNPNLSESQMTVSPEGTVSLPLVGSVKIAGMSLNEADTYLTGLYGKYLVYPSVSVALVSKHADSVYVAGAVERPGAIGYLPTINVQSAIALAGGAAAAGDLTQVTVTHPDGGKQRFDMSTPDLASAADTACPLQPDDVVYVPLQLGEISIVGDVLHAGAIPFQPQMTVLAAITAVGGVNPTADLTKDTITHDGVEGPLNLQALLRQGDMTDNIVVSPGDRILIPTIKLRSFVYGYVAKPGMFVVQPNDHLMDALNVAGGALPTASLAQVRIIRIGADGKPVATEFDLYKYLKSGHGNGNPALIQGDVVYVPDQQHHFQLSDMWNAYNGIEALNLGVHVAQHGLGN